jgi:hypothetical protein
MVRRIAKVIAPEFRVLARSDFDRTQSCLDLKEKTIEVGESSTEFDMVGAVLFQLGHLRLLSNPEYKDHFGKFSTERETVLLKKLSEQGSQADKIAADWAFEIFMANFNVEPERAKAIVYGHVWSEHQWNEYYLSQT